jgi:hypothetical protein
LVASAKALTSMRRVEDGRWKLVSSPDTIRKRWPGARKIEVEPEWGSIRSIWAMCSSVRVVVVPTATMRRFSRRARLRAPAVAAGSV